MPLLDDTFGISMQAHYYRVGVNAERQADLTDRMANKSAFEVDASETGLTNANYPRLTGGNTPAGPTG